MSGDATSIFKVFWFRDGRKEIGRVECETAELALEWAKENEWLGEGKLPIVETTLTVLPGPPTIRGAKQHRVTHTLAHLEHKQPDVVFVCVMEASEFCRTGSSVDEEAQRQIKGSLRSRKASWENLPDEWKNRIRKTDDDCWVWLTTEKHGPYLDVYRRMKGPIPDGVMLCHACGNSRCVNPNHLTERNGLETTHNMPARGSHWR